MDKGMTKEESYVERRQLFKNIWEASMHFDEKDDNIMNKPKVIKTLRLDEVDKCPVGKTKKQRIRNLRHVCTKILDFCDRQDADDEYHAQKRPKEVSFVNGATLAKDVITSLQTKTLGIKLKSKLKKRKTIKKMKSLFTARDATAVMATTSEAVAGNVTLSNDSSEPVSRNSQNIAKSLKTKSKRRISKKVIFSGAPFENNENSGHIPAKRKKRSRKKHYSLK